MSESKQLKYNSINSTLKQIDDFYISNGLKQSNLLRFDIGKQPNYYNYKLVSAFERILRTELCQEEDEIDEEFLEQIKLTINGL